MNIISLAAVRGENTSASYVLYLWVFSLLYRPHRTQRQLFFCRGNILMLSDLDGHVWSHLIIDFGITRGMPFGRLPQSVSNHSMLLGRLPQSISTQGMLHGRLLQAVITQGMPHGRLLQSISSQGMPHGRLPLSVT